MGVRAILLDFDGTSLQEDQVFLSLYNMYAIRQAMKRGILIIPCTGRTEDFFPPQIEKEPEIRYWITSNGARVLDRQQKTVIYHDCFTPEQSAELSRIFEGQKIYCEIAAEGHIYLEREVGLHLEQYKVPPHHVWFVETGRQILLEKPSDYILKHRLRIEKLNLYGIPEEKQELLINRFLDSGLVKLTEGAGKNIQAFPIWHDRIRSAEALLCHLGIDFSQVMSIGDSELDYPMIQCAGIGVAMGNAPQWLKEQADFVTDSNIEDGVARAIEELVL